MNTGIVETAIKILKFRDYSQYELKLKLLQRGYEEATVNEALEYLSERGYLNDAALCNTLVKQYSETSKHSMRGLVTKLKRRGLPMALIMENMEELDGCQLEYQAALKLAARRASGRLDKDMRLKVARYLATKGFTASTISKVLQYLKDMLP